MYQMNIVQESSHMYNGHCKKSSVSTAASKMPCKKHLESTKEMKLKIKFDPNDRPHFDSKPSFSEKLKVLLENGDEVDHSDPYAFSDTEHTPLVLANNLLKSEGISNSNSHYNHLKSFKIPKNNFHESSYKSFSKVVSTGSVTQSHSYRNTSHSQYKKHIINRIKPILSKPAPVDSSKPTSPVVSSGKPLSYLKAHLIKSDIKPDTKSLDKRDICTKLENNGIVHVAKRHMAGSRSLSLDSDVTNHQWKNVQPSRKSLLEESLLGIKKFLSLGNKEEKDSSAKNVSVECSAAQSVQTGTTTVFVPTKQRTNNKPPSKHTALQTIWTVRNQMTALTNDHSVFGPVLSCNELNSHSDAERPVFQNFWFSLNSDHERLTYHDRRRETKLIQMKVEFRHKLKQLQCLYKQEYRDKMAEILVKSAKTQPNLTALLLSLLKTDNKKKTRFKHSLTSTKTLCSFSDSSGRLCEHQAIPCTSYCQLHITYCNQQKLFTTCSAKRDNTLPCTAPVLDNIVDTPLCLEHKRLKLLSHKPKNLILKSNLKSCQPRKRSRSSTSSSRTSRSRKRKRPLTKDKELSTGAGSAKAQTQTPSDVDKSTSSKQTQKELPYLSSLSNLNAQVISKSDVDESQEVEVGEEVLAITADLPLDTSELTANATRLLEEHDFSNVLNHIAADAFNDLFTEDKGEYEPTPQETEELERALEAVDKDVKSLQKLSQTQEIFETFLDEQVLAHTLAHLPEVSANMDVPVLYQNGFTHLDQALYDVNRTLTNSMLIDTNEVTVPMVNQADLLQS